MLDPKDPFSAKNQYTFNWVDEKNIGRRVGAKRKEYVLLANQVLAKV